MASSSAAPISSFRRSDSSTVAGSRGPADGPEAPETPVGPDGPDRVDGAEVDDAEDAIGPACGGAGCAGTDGGGPWWVGCWDSDIATADFTALPATTG